MVTQRLYAQVRVHLAAEVLLPDRLGWAFRGLGPEDPISCSRKHPQPAPGLEKGSSAVLPRGTSEAESGPERPGGMWVCGILLLGSGAV